MGGNNRLELLLKQARKAAISRDFDFAERILLSQEVENIAGKNSPRVLFELGNLYMKAERFDKAFSAFIRLDALFPKNAAVLNRLGTIYRRMGELEKSLDILLKARSACGTSPQLLYNLGNTYKEMHSYGKAKECFMQALELNPDDTLAYNHMGTIEFLLGNYGKALEEYRNGLRIDPNHPFIHFNMARLYRLLNRVDDAEREYIAALKSRPNWQKALKELASLYSMTGALEKQAAVLNRMLSANSKNLPALLESAENAERRGKPDDARRFFQEALSVSESDPLPTEKYARFLADSGEASEAASVIEAYNAENPQDKSLMLDLAKLYMDSNRYSAAKKLLEKYGEDGADDARLLQLSAKMHLALGERDAARQCLEQVVSSSPGKIEARKEFATQLADAGLLQEAREQLKLYQRESPKDLSAKVLLGAVYEQEGDIESALTCYTDVIEKEKDNMRAGAALSLLYQRMGKNTSAVRLAGDIVNAQSAKEGGENLSLLQESLELYEQAVSNYRLSNPVAAAENLRKIARIKDELKKAAESALRDSALKGEAAQAIIPEVPESYEEGEESEEAYAQDEGESPASEEDGEVDIDSLLEALREEGESGEAPLLPQDGKGALAPLAVEERQGEEEGKGSGTPPAPALEGSAKSESEAETAESPVILPSAFEEKAQENVARGEAPAAREALVAGQESPVAKESAQQAAQAVQGGSARESVPQVSQKLPAAWQEALEESAASVAEQEGKEARPETPELQAARETPAIEGASEREPEVEAAESPAALPSAFEEKAQENETCVEEAAPESGEGDVLTMLKCLRETLNFLPQEVLGEYRKSRERLIMEYIILKLSGKPGLRENSIAMSAYAQSALERGEGGESDIPALSETFSLLAALSTELPDKDFAHILEKQAESVQERLAKLKGKGDTTLRPLQ